MSCHILFMHAFSIERRVFLVLTLLESSNVNTRKIHGTEVNEFVKRMCKRAFNLHCIHIGGSDFYFFKSNFQKQNIGSVTKALQCQKLIFV